MRLKKAYLEITNICNLSCSFCPKLTRPARTMTTAEFHHVAKEIAPYATYVYLHIKGEPLCHPQLPEILDICETYHLKVNLTTNGTLLRQQGDMLLCKPAIRQVNISVHSMEKDQDGYLDTVIEFAKKAAAQNRMFTIFRMWTLNDQHLPMKQSVAVMKKIEQAFDFQESLSKLSETGRSQRIAEKVFMTWGSTFTWPSLAHPFVSDTGRCHGLRSMLGILADGTVVPCCLDGNGESPLGNIFETPLQTIMESDPVQKGVAALQKGTLTLPLCQHCTYRTRFP